MRKMWPEVAGSDDEGKGSGQPLGAGKDRKTGSPQEPQSLEHKLYPGRESSPVDILILGPWDPSQTVDLQNSKVIHSKHLSH